MITDLPAAGEAPKSFLARLKTSVSRKKALEYLGMFVLLTVVYYCYFVRDAQVNASSPVIKIEPGQLIPLMVRFLVLTSWPFTLMAFFDSTWRSKDAGNVFLYAWLATNVLWYHKTGCAFCIFAAAFHIIPYLLCACVAHGFGVLYSRPPRNET
jgi:hypothetical protein